MFEGWSVSIVVKHGRVEVVIFGEVLLDFFQGEAAILAALEQGLGPSKEAVQRTLLKMRAERFADGGFVIDQMLKAHATSSGQSHAY